MIIGPKMTVKCIKFEEYTAKYLLGPKDRVTVGSLYFVEEVHEDIDNQTCPFDGCGTRGLKLRDKDWIWCPNWFQPLGGERTEEEVAAKIVKKELVTA